jgi:hypothetical protein
VSKSLIQLLLPPLHQGQILVPHHCCYAADCLSFANTLLLVHHIDQSAPENGVEIYELLQCIIALPRAVGSLPLLEYL